MSHPLRIAVNTRFLIENKLEGIGLFTYESLKRITRSHPEVEFYFLFDRAPAKEFIFSDNVTPVVLFPPARHPFLWFAWFEMAVAHWLKKHNPHMMLSTDGFACLRTDVPQVTVIHDLAFENFSEHVSFLTLRYYKYFVPRFAHKAKRIATVSEFSKQDIVTRYQIAADKIDVVYNGAKEVYHPISDTDKINVRGKYTGGKHYFIYVGSIHPRKNIKHLLLAFEKFKQESGSDYMLLIVGRKAWDFTDVERAHDGLHHKEDVKFLGHVPPADLGQIVAAAFCMVYVSLFEGFGIPIVEAMSAGTPVITSNVSSMPEAAGDAAILVNPYSVSEIASAMQKIFEDQGTRNLLISKGNLQLEKFNWDLTALKLWQCCTKALQ